MCRKCYYIVNKDRILTNKKASYASHKDKYLLRNKTQYSKHRTKILEHKKEYQLKNKEKIKKYYDFFYSKNRHKIIKCNLEYILRRKKVDIGFRFSLNLRGRLKQAFKNNYKGGSAVRDLGCSIEELKQHLEFKFQPGMSWDNYGIYGWHIDHIVPLSNFDLSDPEQLKKACHYTNLQPLWAKDNLKKGNR
jgi:hypothetical protein